MAMAEWPQSSSTSYHSSNTNNCQDLGNSILLLLGLIICINTGINMVTLLWHKLRGFLHHMFCRIVCEKEASKSSSPRKKTQPLKQSFPAVHLRCTMDPVTMTMTPSPTLRHRRRHPRSSAHGAYCPVAWAHDTDDEERLPHQHPATCSHNWDHPADWEGFQSNQGFWAQDAVKPPPQTIRFQQTIEGRPLRREMTSELSLEAYVYPVNPPPPTPQVLSHKNSGVGVGAEEGQQQCSPAPPLIWGPAVVPDIHQRGSSGRIIYDAHDVRRRLRELTQEVEALSHCYPLASGSSTAEGTGKDWVYRPLTER